MFRFLLITFVILCGAQWANANEIELNISDDLIDVRFRSDFEQEFYGRLAYMHARTDGDDADQLSYTFAATGKVENVDVSLGLRPYLFDVDGADGAGVALGGGAALELVDRLLFSVEAYYSPEVITGGDIDDQLDVEVRATYQIIENGSLSLGYRNLEIDAGSADIDVYDDLFLGLTLKF